MNINQRLDSKSYFNLERTILSLKLLALLEVLENNQSRDSKKNIVQNMKY
jgi:hypothetical protein